MGYPKQPGQDAEAHRRVTERALSQARQIRKLEAGRDAMRAVVEAARGLPWWKLDPNPGLRFEGAGEYGAGVFFTPEVAALGAALTALEQKGGGVRFDPQEPSRYADLEEPSDG